MKICKKCGKSKNPASFYLHSKTKDGLQVTCKQCARKLSKENYLKNKEKRKLYAREYYAKNKEYCLNKSAEWIRNNRLKYNAMQRRWRHKHLDRSRAYMRKYYYTHKRVKYPVVAITEVIS